MNQNETITIGVSSCLLGENVRYNGASKNNELTIHVCKQFRCIPICPETAIGLGTPRPAIKLYSHANSTRAIIMHQSMEDISQRLKEYAQKIALMHPELCGYIFKSASPSCGLDDVPTFDCDDNPINTAKGIYAEKLCQVFDRLPTIDETRLRILEQQEIFLNNVAAFHRLKY